MFSDGPMREVGLSGDYGVERRVIPGLCYFGVNSTFARHCDAFQLPTERNADLGRRSGVGLLIVIGPDEAREKIKRALEGMGEAGSKSDSEIMRALPPLEGKSAQVICVEKIGSGVGLRTRVTMLQTGRRQLTHLYTEQNGGQVTYKEEVDGVGGDTEKWQTSSTEQGRRITHVFVGGDRVYVNRLTGPVSQAVEQDSGSGWSSFSVQNEGGETPVMAKILMYDRSVSGVQLHRSPTEVIHRWIESMSARTIESPPILIIRENNEAVE